MMRELGIPLVIGALVGVAVFLIPEPEPLAPFIPTVEDPGVLFPFESGPDGMAQGSVLVIANPERPSNVTWQGPPVWDDLTQQDAWPPNATADITWHTDHIGTIQVEPTYNILCIRAPCPQPEAPWMARPVPDAPGFDATNQSVRLTLYAFNAQGELVASNAPARDIDRFDLYGDFILLGDDPWYLGNGTRADALQLPFGGDVAAAALHGLPVGGIATVHVPDHPYAWLVGELWLTGRVNSFA
ncbi:MAG: hypothetical protein ACPHID_02970 [Thermoplasmatota archaeon]